MIYLWSFKLTQSYQKTKVSLQLNSKHSIKKNISFCKNWSSLSYWLGNLLYVNTNFAIDHCVSKITYHYIIDSPSIITGNPGSLFASHTGFHITWVKNKNSWNLLCGELFMNKLFFPKLRVRILMDNNSSPHGKFRWFLFPHLNFAPYTIFTSGGHVVENWYLVMKARRCRINKKCQWALSVQL